MHLYHLSHVDPDTGQERTTMIVTPAPFDCPAAIRECAAKREQLEAWAEKQDMHLLHALADAVAKRGHGFVVLVDGAYDVSRYI